METPKNFCLCSLCHVHCIVNENEKFKNIFIYFSSKKTLPNPSHLNINNILKLELTLFSATKIFSGKTYDFAFLQISLMSDLIEDSFLKFAST